MKTKFDFRVKEDEEFREKVKDAYTSSITKRQHIMKYSPDSISEKELRAHRKYVNFKNFAFYSIRIMAFWV